jgi:hypothetical protein
MARRRYLKLFWWTLGIFVVLLAALFVLSMSNPDAPFTYVLQ